MPYFTHLRKKSYFAVVETNGKLYIDGQGYDPDTLKPVMGAEFDVFSPVPNTTSFFDFGAPVICLPRSSSICKTSQLASVNSGKVKLFDSSLVLTGQNIGNVGVGTGLSGNLFVGTKKDPSASDQKNDKLLSYSPSFGYLSTKSPISIQTGSETKAYRLNTVFWKPTTGSNLVLGINSESLVRGNTTSNNVVTFNPADTSTYQAVQSDKLELNQLVYLDSTKTNSVSNYAVVNRSQIASSSTRSPQTVMFDTATGSRYVPLVEKVDLGLSSYWIASFGDISSGAGTVQSASGLAVAPNGEVCISSEVCIFKLTPNGSLLWQKNFAGGASAMVFDSSNQLFCTHTYSYTDQSNNSGKVVAATLFSSTGSPIWSKGYVTPQSTATAHEIVTDNLGCIYYVGTTYSGPSNWSYVYKRDTSGGLIWGYPATRIAGVALDSANNVWTAGTQLKNSSTGYYEMWLQKVSADRTPLLYRDMYVTSGFNGWSSIAVDQSDRVYVAGTAGNPSRAYVACYNSSGTSQWAKQGDVVVSATVQVLADKGSDSLYVAYSPASNRVRFIKFDASGNVQWCNQITTSGDQAIVSKLRCDSYGNIYLLFSSRFVSTDKLATFVMKAPPDGSGTGTYAFPRGTLSYESASPSWSAASLTVSNSATGSANNYPYEGVPSVSVSDSAIPSSRQTLGTTYDPVPDSYVGCFASNALWTTFSEGSGPVYFTGNCPFAGSLGLDFVRVRYIAESVPTCKRVWATISNPSSLSLSIPYDMNYRNIRPFLFKNDSNQLMLGVFAYYNGSTTADNVAALMVFSVGSTTQTDSITLTYVQRIDLSSGGIIASVTPVDDTQRAWLINYGDTARVYTFSQASNFTLTTTYTWGRSGQVDSYGIDSRGRLWYTTGDILNYIPLKTDPATVNTALKAYFDSSSYSYSGTTVDSNLYVSAYATDGAREQKTVTVTLQGSSVTFADGTTTKTVTTSASSDLAIPVKIIGSGVFQAKLS